MTVSDGTATASSSSTLTIGNTPPEIASVTFSSTEVYTADLLNVVVSASDAESDPLSYTYEWYVNGSVAFSETNPQTMLHWMVLIISIAMTVFMLL